MVQLISPADTLTVRGGRTLSGTATVDGSKNAALPLLAAAAALGRPVTLTNLPTSSDVAALATLIAEAGNLVVASPDGAHTMHVTPARDQRGPVDRELAARIRASYYLAPALLNYGVANLPWPGGCAVGNRGMELHFAVYEAFGDTVHTSDDGYRISAAKGQARTPVEIKLPFPSRGTTVVALLRALVAGRPLLLHTPSLSPEVTGLVEALRLADHHAAYLPDGSLYFEPGAACPVRWTVPGDKVEAGTLLCAMAATGGHGRVLGVDPRHLTPLIALLTASGFPVTLLPGGVELGADVRLTRTPITAIASLDSLSEVDALDADFEPPLMSLALTQPGEHAFADEINPGRHANLLSQLRRLGAVITEDSPTVCRLTGPQKLTGAHVEALDIRTGSALVVAALAAEGTTVVTRVSQLRRGHADLPGKLRTLGADITDEPREG
ncbi:hypothetical protein [Nonomuraea maritima]|uniref:hypothetical protein n=1 Tax=Nonomuraea maritima TaxID=683260 RepID=UPI00371E6E6E